jgi:hypothetical protein
MSCHSGYRKQHAAGGASKSKVALAAAHWCESCRRCMSTCSPAMLLSRRSTSACSRLIFAFTSSQNVDARLVVPAAGTEGCAARASSGGAACASAAASIASRRSPPACCDAGLPLLVPKDGRCASRWLAAKEATLPGALGAGLGRASPANVAASSSACNMRFLLLRCFKVPQRSNDESHTCSRNVGTT